MIENKLEQISALMDGELDKDTLAGFVVDKSTRDIWCRYQMISDVIHQRALQAPPDLAAKISGLIKNEPTVLAPPISRSRPFSAYIKPVAGLAVAASVATIAILGIQQFQQDSLTSPGQVVAQANPVVQVQPAIANVIQVQQPSIELIRPVQMEIQSDARMNRYIMNHNEYQSNVGVQGVMPYVRLVTTDNDE